MIRPTQTTEESDSAAQESPALVVLARYGLVPQVARFSLDENQVAELGSELQRGVQIVVESERGPELAVLLEVVRPVAAADAPSVTGKLVRIATDADRTEHDSNRRQAELEFFRLAGASERLAAPITTD